MGEFPPQGRQSRGTTRERNLLVHVPAALWECWDQCYWWTYQRHCGVLGPEILVDVPAALCKRWAQGVRRNSGPAGQPTRELVGRVTVFVSGNPAVFFNKAGTSELASKEFYMVSAWLVLRPLCPSSSLFLCLGSGVSSHFGIFGPIIHGRQRLPGPWPAAWMRSGVEGDLKFASVYVPISLVPGDLDYD